ncbi:uncharacterized protein LAESUDRAFT_722833 [Laetiporus sulphureus 93-53]|uniref:Uncharacterized protein n=1 Tax=Laetiporus sulphureus 93-53 TaxID=1314785 RepID=A0A165FKY2_9APHY|nr:uncharacterized protein LAESUDRAFT_722833 [Laetiporus sulphureus 93-53]KZT09127.1 hypothetical protein LAESUDRAFT_722833 [Laetiporus sulphureus 93-53]
MSTRHSFLSTTGLIRAPSDASSSKTRRPAKFGGTKPGQTPRNKARLTRIQAGIIPLSVPFLVGMVIAFSLIFIVSISCAFIGSDDDEPPFRELLNSVAKNDPGIVLIGDNVDVDVDEPAITIRWSIVGCGSAYILPGSEGTHGSDLCGLPSLALDIYVDSSEDPAVTYDPAQFPIVNGTGQRISIQNLCQFDSDHVLDVHLARLYPFDTYLLTSTLRAVSAEHSDPMGIRALTTLQLTSSFAISSTDVKSYMNNSDNWYEPTRDITLKIRRPAEARLFAMMLFGINWMLAHATWCFVVLAWRLKSERNILRYFAIVVVILFATPQLRNAMPDAPGLDGVLLDSIGFFPQMLSSGVSAIVLLVMAANRTLQTDDDPQMQGTEVALHRLSKGLGTLRRQGSSMDFSHLRSWSQSAFRSTVRVAEDD